MPGLDPISVQEVVGGAEEHFDVAFIQDTQQRRWVIRAPRTEVAAAHMDASLAMLALLVRRVPFAVPAAKGFAPIPKIGRAAVHAYIPGHPLDVAALQPGHPVTAELGRTIAMIHNIDRALYDEAGLASYDAESYRRRHLAEIDWLELLLSIPKSNHRDNIKLAYRDGECGQLSQHLNRIRT